MAEVYWIHLPEHTDVFTQGYVGFTSKTTTERFNEHLKYVSSERQGRNRYHLYNAIRKYGVDQLVVTTLVICEDDYGLELEFKLRPTENIGWNMVVGGKAPMLGREMSKESIEQQKRSWQNSFTEERRESLKRASKASAESWSEERRLAAIELQKRLAPSKIMYRGHSANPAIWVHAEEFFGAFLKGIRKKTLEKAFSKPSKHFNALFDYFERGWIPDQDTEWIEYKTNHLPHYTPDFINSVISNLGTPKEQYEKHNNCRRNNVT